MSGVFQYRGGSVQQVKDADTQVSAGQSGGGLGAVVFTMFSAAANANGMWVHTAAIMMTNATAGSFGALVTHTALPASGDPLAAAAENAVLVAGAPNGAVLPNSIYVQPGHGLYFLCNGSGRAWASHEAVS